jgi:hypothetical protein
MKKFSGGITKTKETLRPERPEDDLGIRHIPLSRNSESVNKNDVREDVLFEGFDGFKYIQLNADEETKARLSRYGIVTKWENEDSYRLRIQEGDLVRLPDGRLGTVRMIEHNVGGHEKVVSVDVDDAPRRWFGLCDPLPLRFAGSEIHYLKFVSTKEDMDAILAECNE